MLYGAACGIFCDEWRRALADPPESCNPALARSGDVDAEAGHLRRDRVEGRVTLLASGVREGDGGREGGDEIETIEGGHGCNSELVSEGRVARGRVDESRFEETAALGHEPVIKFRWKCCVHRRNDLERTEFYILCLI